MKQIAVINSISRANKMNIVKRLNEDVSQSANWADRPSISIPPSQSLTMNIPIE
jgi:hypothetical protein